MHACMHAWLIINYKLIVKKKKIKIQSNQGGRQHLKLSSFSLTYLTHKFLYRNLYLCRVILHLVQVTAQVIYNIVTACYEGKGKMLRKMDMVGNKAD